MPNNVWERLGIGATSDQTIIRKAYSKLIREYRPDSHPAEFSAIRSAYEEALVLAQNAPDIGNSREVIPTDTLQVVSRDVSPDLPGPYDWNVDAEQAIVHQAMDQRNNALLIAWLDESYVKAHNGTFDAMADFEVFLAHLLLNHAVPPPFFVEACARKLSWTTRWMVLAEAIGDDACLRLRGLLQLAVHHRFATTSTANKWHRYLFSDASIKLLEVGWSPLLQRARKAAQEWRQQCEKYGFRGYLSLLNQRAIPHVDGDTVQSCDIKNAFLVATYALFFAYKLAQEPLAIWMMILLWISLFTVVTGFRPVWRLLRTVFELDSLIKWILRIGLALIVLAFICGLAQHELSAILWLEEAKFIFKSLCVIYGLGTMLWINWWMVRAYDMESRVFSLQKIDRADDVWWENERGER